MEQMHHEKNRGGEGFCRNLAYLGGEMRKLFVHFAGHQVSDFKAKCTKFDFGWGSAPDPAGGANSAPPDPLAGFKGAYF